VRVGSSAGGLSFAARGLTLAARWLRYALSPISSPSQGLSLARGGGVGIGAGGGLAFLVARQRRYQLSPVSGIHTPNPVTIVAISYLTHALTKILKNTQEVSEGKGLPGTP